MPREEMKASAGYSLLSHPDTLLQEHLHMVHDTGMQLFEQNAIFMEYHDCLKIALLFHDLGKASTFFQQFIQGEYNGDGELKRHGEIGALWTYYYLVNRLGKEEQYAYFGYLIVKYHHGDLLNFREMGMDSLSIQKLGEINDQIDFHELNNIFRDRGILTDIKQEELTAFLEEGLFYRKSRKWKKELTIKSYLLLNYLFSILVFSDKHVAKNREVYQESNNGIWRDTLIPLYKANLSRDNPMSEIREEAYVDVMNTLCKTEDKLMSLNLPTGTGKTLTSMQAAIRIREKYPEKKRIIYCLPFTSIIDQNAEVMQRILEANGLEVFMDNLLVHHHRSFANLPEREGNEEITEKKVNPVWQMETWQSELVVTTFYQFLGCIFSNQNNYLKRFFALSHSIVILDEVQAIPFKYWKLISEVLSQITAIFDVHIILCTATMPLIFPTEQVGELVTNREALFQKMNRTSLIRKGEVTIDAFIDHIVEEHQLNPEKSKLIIVNTIKASLMVYERLLDQFPESALIYLSTNIIPKHRLERIKEIKDNAKGKIVVSTQLVEAGVDIDLDIVYRDMAPMDSLFQAAGRCNRNNRKDKGLVEIWELTGNKDKTFWSYIYDPILISCTKEIIETGLTYPEADFHHLADKYYHLLKDRKRDGSDTILNAIKELRYKTAYVKDKEDKNNDIFELIEDMPKISAFVEWDDEATELLSQYRDLLGNNKLDPFQKKDTLKRLWGKMGPYILSVPRKNYPNNKEDSLVIIEREEVWSIYTEKTGYHTESKYEDYCI